MFCFFIIIKATPRLTQYPPSRVLQNFVYPELDGKTIFQIMYYLWPTSGISPLFIPPWADKKRTLARWGLRNTLELIELFKVLQIHSRNGTTGTNNSDKKELIRPPTDWIYVRSLESNYLVTVSASNLIR